MSTPSARRFRRPSAPPADAGADLSEAELRSKFRWQTTTGHYFLGGRAVNVGWGRKGAAPAAPIVVDELVTLEGEAPRAAPKAKVVRRAGTGGVAAAQAPAAASHHFAQSSAKMTAGV